MLKQHEQVSRQLKLVRGLISLFITALILSGLTAFPIQSELTIAKEVIVSQRWDNNFTRWVDLVNEAVHETNTKYPFIAYGTDWLAFAHIILAMFFVRLWFYPIRDAWLIDYGLMACVSIFPLAFVAGSTRQIPFFWQLIDCSFGFFGGALLLLCRKEIKKLKHLQQTLQLRKILMSA